MVLYETTREGWCELQANVTGVEREADMYTKLMQEINSVMLNPSPLVDGEISPYTYHGTGPIFYCGLFLAIAWVTTALISLWKSGATDFRSGRYLAFTWDLENTLSYRVMLKVCLAFGGANVCGCLFVAIVNERVPAADLPKHFPHLTLPIVLQNLPSIVVLLLSGYGMSKSYPPGFAWRSKGFADEVFDGRPWLDLFTTSNDRFGSNVSAALLKSQLGDGKSDPFLGLMRDSASIDRMRLLGSQGHLGLSARGHARLWPARATQNPASAGIFCSWIN